MALTASQLKTLRTRSVVFEDEVLKKFGPLHKKIAQHIFAELRLATVNMDSLFITGLGKFGPNVNSVKKACHHGWLTRDGHGEICEKMQERIKKRREEKQCEKQ